MDKKLKAKWITALRSGKMAQTTGQLTTGRSFCCLGVLEKVCGTPIATMKKSNDEVCLADANGKNILRGLNVRTRTRLSRMNDDGKKFPAIAAWIEKHVR